MRKNRVRPQYLLAALMLFPAAGCSMMHSNVPVAVTVIDAESKTPIPGAQVVFLYPTDNSDSHLRDVTGTTAANGVAQIQAATGEGALPQVRISAVGYLAEEKRLPGDALRGIKEVESSWPFTHHEPVPFAMEIYRGPDPAVDLTVQPGFRGQIKVELNVREDVVYEPNKRMFAATVPADGSVTVEGPPILRHGHGPIFLAHYADDAQTKIPTSDLADNQVGFRWLRTEGRTEVFIVGTKSEYESYRRATDKNPASDAGNGKSGKGGGRRGGSGSSGSN